jgi:hypothetical protein
MNLKLSMTVAAVAASLSSVGHADTVWVEPNQSVASFGSFDGTGTEADPYHSIQQAYASLWTTAGDHEIRLKAGTYTGATIGRSNSSTASGFVWMSGGWAFSGTAAWNSVTLTAAPSAAVTIRMEDQIPDVSPAAFQTGYRTQNHYPAAVEREIVTNGGAVSVNRGQNVRGLINIFNQGVKTLNFKDLTIEVAGGHALFSAVNTSAPAVDLGLTNVDLYLNSNVSPLAGGPGSLGTPPAWGRSNLFWHIGSQTALNDSSINFHDSNLYVDLRTYDGREQGWLVGTTFSSAPSSGTSALLPANFVNGNDTSTLFYKTESAWVQQNSPVYSGATSQIFQSSQNISAGDRVYNYESGVGDANQLVVAFVPEPPTLALLGLAGLGALGGLVQRVRCPRLA